MFKVSFGVAFQSSWKYGPKYLKMILIQVTRRVPFAALNGPG